MISNKSLSLALMMMTLISTRKSGAEVAANSAANTLRFSGYDWEVRESVLGGPGPNRWDARNVWVDQNGSLHLKISRVQGSKGVEWHCAELSSKRKFGMGQLEFQTSSRVDQLDRNVVLGLFDYPTPEEGLDGTNEIDIEFARWGKNENPNGNFSVYPESGPRGNNCSHPFEYALPHAMRDFAPRDCVATHRFTRAKTGVTFATYAGTGSGQCLAHWAYKPSEPRLIPQKPLPVHLNLWLFQGTAPSDGKEVEVVVKKFAWTSYR